MPTMPTIKEVTASGPGSGFDAGSLELVLITEKSLVLDYYYYLKGIVQLPKLRRSELHML